jgi:predicted Ser/Thr protein kinase
MGDASGAPGADRDALIGRLALERRWVTPLQLREALAELSEDVEGGRLRSLGSILVSKGILTAGQLEQLQQQIRDAIPAFPPFGKYDLLREIGRGAAGVVYEAEDTGLQRRVALKLLTESPDRIGPELHLCRSLPPHPGIVPVLETGVYEGRAYLAMELVDGTPLGIWNRNGSVTVRQRVAMLRDVALALHHAHTHGIVHGGVKPENILVDRNRQPWITDFGVARLAGAPGPAGYRSPEQARGDKALDARSDLYSLGVLLYEILSGRQPGDPVEPPSKISGLKINPMVFQTLENICLIALAKDPKERYVDAATFARDLTRWLQGEDPGVVAPRSRRSRVLFRRILMVAAAITVVVAAVVTVRRHREKDPVAVVKGMAVPAIPVEPLQSGAIVESFAGLNFNVLALRKIDNRVAFDDPAPVPWRTGPWTWTSQRWTGFLRIFRTATYTFEVVAKEHTRLAINDMDLASGAGPKTVTITLEEGTHRFLLEHSHENGEDAVGLLWKKDGEPTASPLGPVSLLHLRRDFREVTPGPVRSALPLLPGVEEGEMLRVLDHSGRPPRPHPYSTYGAQWKGTWSGDSHLWWGPGVRDGDRLTLRFVAGETGRATLALGLTRATDHGIFRISVNGKEIAKSLDLWSRDLMTGEVEFKDVDLKQGANELEFRVVGSNPSAQEWGPGSGVHKLGLDYVLVR